MLTTAVKLSVLTKVSLWKENIEHQWTSILWFFFCCLLQLLFCNKLVMIQAIGTNIWHKGSLSFLICISVQLMAAYIPVIHMFVPRTNTNSFFEKSLSKHCMTCGWVMVHCYLIDTCKDEVFLSVNIDSTLIWIQREEGVVWVASKSENPDKEV